MLDLFTVEALTALFQVVVIDLVLAGDNAIVIGLAAAGLPPEQRARAILIGLVAATALRIAFAAIATQLLSIIGLLLAGGILLLWVCWKMWRDLRAPAEGQTQLHVGGRNYNGDGTRAADGSGKTLPQKTLLQVSGQIIIADVSLSLDNVLAVAGAAREAPWVLIFGLGLSIVLMGTAASFIAGIIERYRWIAYVGVAIILYVALDMIVRGAVEVWPAIRPLANS
jgi:YjbE family integral membrane protein